MKYCVYCGAVLPGGAVSFCPECGNALPQMKKKEEQGDRGRGKADAEKREVPLQKEKRENGEFPVTTGQHQFADEELPEEGYDGYYDDILPEDADLQREGIDTALVWKIAALIAGLLVIVGACIALMYFL